MKLIKLSLVAALFTTAMYAGNEAAVEETDDLEISANVALTSNYVWRGMTQSHNSPAIQGGFDLDYKGAYVGIWGSNVEFGDSYPNASLEADLYAGYANEIAGFSYDVGYVQYTYANESDELNFGEAYAKLGYDFEVVAVGAAYYMGIETNDTDPDDAWEVSASAPLPMEFSVDATYGDYDTLGAYYLVGVNKSLGKFDFTLAYTANDETDEDNFVVSVGTSF